MQWWQTQWPAVCPLSSALLCVGLGECADMHSNNFQEFYGKKAYSNRKVGGRGLLGSTLHSASPCASWRNKVSSGKCVC